MTPSADGSRLPISFSVAPSKIELVVLEIAHVSEATVMGYMSRRFLVIELASRRNSTQGLASNHSAREQKLIQLRLRRAMNPRRDR